MSESGVYSSVSKEQRAVLRGKCQDDLYFLTKEVLGMDKLVPHLHRPICDFVQTVNYKGLLLIPRRWYKTTIVTIADSIQTLLKCLPRTSPTTKPVFNISTLLVTNTAENVEMWMADIKNTLESNDSLLSIFPEIEPSKNWWRERSIRLKGETAVGIRTGHIDGIGVGGKVTGRGYHRIKLDDVVDRENSRTPMGRFEIKQWYAMMQPVVSKGVELIVGTRYHHDDLYGIKLKDDGYKRLVLGWMGADGHSRFPEQYPDEIMEQIRRGMETGEGLDGGSSYLFSCQFENDPIPDYQARFKSDWLRHNYVSLPKSVKWDILAAVDPSPGTPTGDPSGIVVVGCVAGGPGALAAMDTRNPNDPTPRVGDWYILHSESHRYPPEDLAVRVIRLHNMYHPRKWVIESNGVQVYLKTAIENVRRRYRAYLPIIWGPSETMMGKEARISDLIGKFEFNRVYLRGGDEHLRQELRHYDKWRTDDVLDALSYVKVVERQRLYNTVVSQQRPAHAAPSIRDMVELGAGRGLQQQGWL